MPLALFDTQSWSQSYMHAAVAAFSTSAKRRKILKAITRSCLLENSTSQLPVPAAASALCASATGTVLLMSLLLLLLLVVALVVDGCNQGHAARRPQPGGNLLEPGRGGDLKQAGAPGAPTVAAAAAWGAGLVGREGRGEFGPAAQVSVWTDTQMRCSG